ncbi:MAG TPA: hypothetical protein VJ183_05625 [Chloroflexia bacterium]|nr:hypothetical protein [Chloroflexia bacterium]
MNGRNFVSKVSTTIVLTTLLASGLARVGNPYTVAAQMSTPPNGQSAQGYPFADPAFERVWRRTDWLVLNSKVKRSYFWGPGPISPSLNEQYAEGIGGTHRVQYFDKSRMEINNPNGNRNDKFFVTNGLLTTELITGKMQVGDYDFITRWPADIPIASDVDDQSAPTYASFRGAIARTDANAVGKVVINLVSRTGALDFVHGGAPYMTYDTYNVKNAYYEAATKHNIPDVFWSFLNATGQVMSDNNQQVNARLNDPYFYATGYPIADAYWASVKIEGKVGTPVLIQPYQRRVLTYVPSAPAGFKVQMGNIGQHYYDWRYRDQGKPPTLTGRCGLGYPMLGFGKVYENNIVKFQLGCQMAAETRLTVTRQRFEHEQYMLGVTYYDFYSGRFYEDVFILYYDRTAQSASFLPVDTNTPPGPVPTAPPGTFSLPRNFASVLAANPSARSRLGNATSPAETIQLNKDGTGGSPVQYFDGGLMVYPNVADRKIYVLYNTSGYAYTYQGPHVRFTEIDRWEVHDDTFQP